MKPYTSFDDIPNDKISLADAVSYLNEIIIRYGQPCNHCEHFEDSRWCSLNHRPRSYDLQFGPFEKWYIRKHCSDLIISACDTENVGSKITNALDCNFQQYCK